MGLDTRFSEDNLVDIIDQASVYTCACPSQVCKAILQQRALYHYQERCLGKSYTDHKVHQAIAKSVETTHAELERCLVEILELEGWDMERLIMPADLEKELAGEIEERIERGEWSSRK
jgi:hypothetical protein